MNSYGTEACPLICPVCEGTLHRTAATFECSLGHSFDVAKEGYVNLLVPQHKSRGIDGDLPTMLQARRRFLEAGFYGPLRDLIVDKVDQILGAREAADARPTVPECVLEVGCGEGYYIAGVSQTLSDSRDTLCLGTDLSKAALKLAARRAADTLFFVSDLRRRIYVQTGAMSVLLDVFARRNPAEFARVLETKGSALVVIPSESHLASLRDRLGLLGIEDEKERRVLERFADTFNLVDRLETTYPIRLPAEAVQDLLDMGPNYWHRPSEPAALDSTPHETEASFVLLHLQKHGAG